MKTLKLALLQFFNPFVKAGTIIDTGFLHWLKVCLPFFFIAIGINIMGFIVFHAAHVFTDYSIAEALYKSPWFVNNWFIFFFEWFFSTTINRTSHSFNFILALSLFFSFVVAILVYVALFGLLNTCRVSKAKSEKYALSLNSLNEEVKAKKEAALLTSRIKVKPAALSSSKKVLKV